MIKSIKISIIIPVYNEGLYISDTVDSLLNQNTSYNHEIIIVDGMSTDGTRKIIQDKINRNPNKIIKLFDNKKRIVSSGFNIGLTNSVGDIIIRVDGHSKLDKSYIKNCILILKEVNADCVGGTTEHKSNNFIGSIITKAQTSNFGTGGVVFRKNINKGMYTDTLAFGAYKREVFNKIGGYDEELVRNQDDEFNFRLIQSGGKIWIDPRIKSIYFNRSSTFKLAKQYFQYGFYKLFVMRKRNGIASIRHIIPGFFVLGLFLSYLLMAFNLNQLFFQTIILSYSITNLICTIISLKEKSFNLFSLFSLFFMYFVIHLSYGIGTVVGCIYILFSKGSKDIVDTNFDKKIFNTN